MDINPAWVAAPCPHDPQRALVFDSMVQAIEAAGRYRQAYHVSPGAVTIQPWR